MANNNLKTEQKSSSIVLILLGISALLMGGKAIVSKLSGVAPHGRVIVLNGIAAQIHGFLVLTGGCFLLYWGCMRFQKYRNDQLSATGKGVISVAAFFLFLFLCILLASH
ncbi:MAG: hypothetical protein HQL14_05750 [Candidatus Omnitrophica bacterium]|nr:hypothetical protein [Candidatus Omnitrophota bacterium]